MFSWLTAQVAGTACFWHVARYCRQLSTAATAAAPFEVCVVGSGPAGFYTAEKLLKRFGEAVRVTVVDRLATPFGLVRSGVAPDHPETKNVTNQFTACGRNARVSFCGNVTVGRDVSLAELRSLFHATVLAYGAESDRKLGVPGEAAAGVLSAREFVWWYNGHPDMPTLPVDLSKVESVAICGIGNVALDCARLLLRPPSELAGTDIADRALRQLRERSAVKEVHLIARRGPVQAACTAKELKELLGTTGVSVHIPPEALAVSPEDAAEMKAVRAKRRLHELLGAAAAGASSEGAARRLHFDFYRSPAEIIHTGGHVSGIRLERTALAPAAGGGVAAVGTGQFEVLPTQLVLSSIGYRSLPLPGLPFDQKRGTVPNAAGRVVTAPGAAETEPGLYVCGWLKRGPTGIVGTNLTCAEETSAVVHQDLASGAVPAPQPPAGAPRGADGLRALLSSRGVPAVAFDRWERIDAAEVAAGAIVGKPREKIVTAAEQLKAAGLA